MSSGKSNKTHDPNDFEKMCKRLDEIVSYLETGNTTLVDSVKLYEEGANLVADCRKLLERATVKVEKIQSKLKQDDSGISEVADSGNGYDAF